ncbi:DUF202 domain-containing protein [Streptosporangiaceae bacterium NEAU-GS5]|nr:DUF202 domain-containing protein [Streptosporangiaceae bacterium NEAU-GS5]
MTGPGLSIERTHLAWTRTATVLAAAGLLAGGAAARHGISGVSATAFVLASLCGAVLLARTGSRDARLSKALRDGEPLDHRLDALIAWIGVLCATAGALVFVLT